MRWPLFFIRNALVIPLVMTTKYCIVGYDVTINCQFSFVGFFDVCFCWAMSQCLLLKSHKLTVCSLSFSLKFKTNFTGSKTRAVLMANRNCII